MNSRRAWIEGAAALAGGAAAWGYFAAVPPMRALVGWRAIEALVPAHYQASAFPAYAALLAAAVMEWAPEPRSSKRRLALLAMASGVATLRLAKLLPLSGHAVFLVAALVFEHGCPPGPARKVRLAAIGAGLAVTAAYKLGVWHDGAWFAASLLVGSTLGLGARRGAVR